LNKKALHIDNLTLQSFAQGDPAAFTLVYNRYYPDLYFLAKRLVNDSAADVLADVFMQAWSQKKLFDSPEHLISYMYTMTRNACFDFLKKQSKDTQRLQDLRYVSEREHQDDYFHEITEGRLFSLIREEIEQLPPHIRKVFKLSYINGLKNAEIAQLLGMKDASIRVRKAEALRILRAAFYNIDLAVFMLFFFSEH
jgi:RNA polymerase sigma-70 factor (ECF subfamily)